MGIDLHGAGDCIELFGVWRVRREGRGADVAQQHHERRRSAGVECPGRVQRHADVAWRHVGADAFVVLVIRFERVPRRTRLRPRPRLVHDRCRGRTHEPRVRACHASRAPRKRPRHITCPHMQGGASAATPGLGFSAAARAGLLALALHRVTGT